MASRGVMTERPRRYAGGPGIVPVQPEAGLRALLTSGESGALEEVRVVGTAGSFDQYTVWRWTWDSGPEAGREGSGYGRTFWAEERRCA